MIEHSEEALLSYCKRSCKMPVIFFHSCEEITFVSCLNCLSVPRILWMWWLLLVDWSKIWWMCFNDFDVSHSWCKILQRPLLPCVVMIPGFLCGKVQQQEEIFGRSNRSSALLNKNIFLKVIMFRMSRYSSQANPLIPCVRPWAIHCKSYSLKLPQSSHLSTMLFRI